MTKRLNFRDQVRQRAQRIIGESRERSTPEEPTLEGSFFSRPTLLSRIVQRLPDTVKSSIREALGPDPAGHTGRTILKAAREEMRDVRNREAALEASRRELSKREKHHQEALFELRAKEAKLGALQAELERVSRESQIERRIPMSHVEVDQSKNPRPLRGISRLAANISRFGQLTPVVVRENGEGRFELITGYRRMAALKEASATHVLCRVVTDLDDATAAALRTVENCLVEGVSSNAVKHLAQRAKDDSALQEVVRIIIDDDDSAVETGHSLAGL